MTTQLLLLNKITGLKTHLRIFADGTSIPCYNITSDDLVINSKDWRAYVRTVCEEPPHLLPEAFRRASQSILNLEENGKSTIIPANLILPETRFQTELDRYLLELSSFLQRNPPTYLNLYFKKEADFLKKMQPAYILEDRFNECSVEDTQGLVKTFTPNREGYAKPVVYDNFKSPTGRLVVVEGPHVLTILKRYRDVISSSYPNGKILSIDYVALEPSVLLGRTTDALSNWLSSTDSSTNDICKDVYQAVADVLFDQGLLLEPLERQEAKAIVLRTLYGAQEDLIGQVVQGKNSVPLQDFLFEVKELFGINSLLQDLQAERRGNGGRYITNHYGRRIPTEGVEDYKLINYWTQSTAVDVALLGFASMFEQLEEVQVKPLFVLHDAMFLDVSPDAIPQLKKAVVSARSIPLFPSKHFHLKIKIEP